MLVEIEAYKNIKQYLDDHSVTLVAVSKTKPNKAIEELYNLGQKDFGENYVQELVDKEITLPKDIRWHFIGHLQSNKVKYIAPFVHLIHGVDSLKLLQEINKQAIKNNRMIHCLLQVYIANEETKFGMNELELQEAITGASFLKNIIIVGFMGMASFSDNISLVQNEFKNLQAIFIKYQQDNYPQVQLSILSMGMSGDYQMAIENGSTMVRIGSLLFGARNYVK
jgi:pyridoxal phosphate enzyme (YggS family)